MNIDATTSEVVLISLGTLFFGWTTCNVLEPLWGSQSCTLKFWSVYYLFMLPGLASSKSSILFESYVADQGASSKYIGQLVQAMGKSAPKVFITKIH